MCLAKRSGPPCTLKREHKGVSEERKMSPRAETWLDKFGIKPYTIGRLSKRSLRRHFSKWTLGVSIGSASFGVTLVCVVVFFPTSVLQADVLLTLGGVLAGQFSLLVVEIPRTRQLATRLEKQARSAFVVGIYEELAVAWPGIFRRVAPHDYRNIQARLLSACQELGLDGSGTWNILFRFEGIDGSATPLGERHVSTVGEVSDREDPGSVFGFIETQLRENHPDLLWMRYAGMSVTVLISCLSIRKRGLAGWKLENTDHEHSTGPREVPSSEELLRRERDSIQEIASHLTDIGNVSNYADFATTILEPIVEMGKKYLSSMDSKSASPSLGPDVLEGALQMYLNSLGAQVNIPYLLYVAAKNPAITSQLKTPVE